MAYLLDTNVISETRKIRCDPHVQNWLASVPGDRLHLSALVVGELRQGVERLRRRDPVQAAALEQWLTQLRTVFSDRIAPVTVEVAELWGRLNVPDPLPVVDGLLAATALVHDWTLVTRNTKDVQRTGVLLLDPFGPP